MTYTDNFTNTQLLNRVEILPEFVDPEKAECVYREAILLGIKRTDRSANNGNTDPRRGIKLGRCATARLLNVNPMSEKHITEIRKFAKGWYIPADTLDVTVIGPESSITGQPDHVGPHMVINCIANSILAVKESESTEGLSTDLQPGDAYIVRNPIRSRERPLLTVTNISPLQENVSVTLR